MAFWRWAIFVSTFSTYYILQLCRVDGKSWDEAGTNVWRHFQRNKFDSRRKDDVIPVQDIFIEATGLPHMGEGPTLSQSEPSVVQPNPGFSTAVPMRQNPMPPGTYVNRIEPPGHRIDPARAYGPSRSYKPQQTDTSETFVKQPSSAVQPSFYAPPTAVGTAHYDSYLQPQRRPIFLTNNFSPDIWRPASTVNGSAVPQKDQQRPRIQTHEYTSPNFIVTTVAPQIGSTSTPSPEYSPTPVIYPLPSTTPSTSEEEEDDEDKADPSATTTTVVSEVTNTVSVILQSANETTETTAISEASTTEGVVEGSTDSSQSPTSTAKVTTTMQSQPAIPPYSLPQDQMVPYHPESASPSRAPNYIPGRPYQRPGSPPSTGYNRPPLPPSVEPSKYSVYSPKVDDEGEVNPRISYRPPNGTRIIAPTILTSPTTEMSQFVPNRPVGKARTICEQSGIYFEIKTIFPFTGQIFARDKKRTPGCFRSFQNTEAVNASFQFSDCGIRKETEASSLRPSMIDQYYVHLIVLFEQLDHTATVQSYILQCVQQRPSGLEKNGASRRIEEALKELQLSTVELEQKASLPEIKFVFFEKWLGPDPHPDLRMRILTNSPNKPADGVDVEGMGVRIGQPLRIEFVLSPGTDAYGFIVRNCIVGDGTSRHQIIDQNGCSNDQLICSHPQYDVAKDTARVYLHAFKLPDNSNLTIRCRVELCTEIPDEKGFTNCALIPTPPFCTDTVTSPLETLPTSTNVSKHKRSRDFFDHFPMDRFQQGLLISHQRPSIDMEVHASICIQQQSGNSIPVICDSTANELELVRKSRFLVGQPSQWKIPQDPLLIGLVFCSCLFAFAVFLNFLVFPLLSHRKQSRESKDQSKSFVIISSKSTLRN